MVLSKRIGDYISGDKCVFESDVLPKLVERDKLGAYQHDGFWQFMDTHREQTPLEAAWRGPFFLKNFCEEKPLRDQV